MGIEIRKDAFRNGIPVLSCRALRQRGACSPQISKFTEVFGEGPVALNPDTLRKAAESGLDLDWMARTSLASGDYQDYMSAVGYRPFKLDQDSYDRWLQSRRQGEDVLNFRGRQYDLIRELNEFLLPILMKIIFIEK